MTTSNRLAITELASTQTDRAATVNEMIAKMEVGANVFACITVLLNTPAVGPAEGDCYIVGLTPTGAWSSYAGRPVTFSNGAWVALPVLAGMEARETTSGDKYVYLSGAWALEVSGGGGASFASTIEQLTGTNTTKASTPNAVAALWEQGSDVASAGTISFGEGGYFNITGTTTITDIDFATDKAGRSAKVKFAGALTLTAGANLILPVSGNIVTAAGDTAEFVSEGSDVVRCIFYQRATGYPLNGTASTTEVLEGGNDKKTVTPDALAALWEAGADITDGAAITIGEGGYFNLITSTTAITSFVVTVDTAGRTFRVRFNTIRTLTHHATSLILPGGANITTAAGDIAQFRSLGGGNVVCDFYTKASGFPVAGGGGTTGKHTINIPASAMLSATTSGPASAQFETSTNDINFMVMDFDATADEHAHFNICFPKSWALGTITFQVWWTTTATDTDGVAWGLQAIALSDNDVGDTAWGTPVVVTDDAQGAAGEILVSAESGAVTIGGTPADDDIVFFRVFRDVSDANDDMTEDARLIAVKVFFTTDAENDT